MIAAKSFMARVRASLPDLHPSERRLAESVLNFPGDMAGYSASEIAVLSGVSNATVSRFVRKIGYASYDEARKAVREEGRKGAALLRFDTNTQDDKDVVASHLEHSRENLQDTYASIEADAVDDLVSAIKTAPRLWVAGFRAGYSLANYLGWQIGQILPHVSLVPRPGETLSETAATFGEKDVVVLIALRRAPKSAISLAEVAMASGSRVALVTDIISVEMLDAHWRFNCATASDGPLLNHTGVLALCNLIAARTFERAEAVERQRLGQIEDLHDRFGEL